MTPRVDVGLASLVGNTPRPTSTRMRVQSAPQTHPNLGDLFLVMQGGTDKLCSAFSDALVSTYYSSETSSIVNGLMNGMQQAAHTVALGTDLGDPIESLGSSGAIVHGTDLYIAQLPPSQVYILRDGRLNALPEAQTEPEFTPHQEIELFRVNIDRGDLVALTSTDLAHSLTDREIQGMVRGRSAQTAAHDLCALIAQRGGRRCEIMILHIDSTGVLPSSTSSDFTPETSAALSSSTFASSPNGSSTETQRVGLSESTNDLLHTSDPRTSQIPTTQTLSQRLLSFPLTVVLIVVVLPVTAIRTVTRLLTGQRASISGSPSESDVVSDTPDSLLDDDWESLRSLRETGRTSSTMPALPESVRIDNVGMHRREGRDPFHYRRRRSLPGPGTLLFVLSLILLSVMIAVLVIRAGEQSPSEQPPITGAGQTEKGTNGTGAIGDPEQPNATEIFKEAQELFREARSPGPDDSRAVTILNLREAKDLANAAMAACSAESACTIAPDINRLLSEIGREENRVNRVTPIGTSATIGEFDSSGVGAAIEQLDVREDSKYVIDGTNGRVIQFDTAREGATVLRRGDTVSSVEIQNPIAVVNRAMNVVVVDDRYNLVSLQPDPQPARLLVITGTENWAVPVAFDNFNNNFYVLDRGANKIYKYQGTAGGYELPPTSYVKPSEMVDLTDAIDFAIDGDIYVLKDDGSIVRLRGGRILPFKVKGLDGDRIKATQIFTEVDTESLYLVDPSRKRIVEIDKREESEGAFVRQFKFAGSDDFFADIKGIWVSEIDGKMVVLGGKHIRQFVLPKIPNRST